MRLKQNSVLIVEDDLLISLLEQRILSALGYQILAKVTDGESAVMQARLAIPDFIIMDISLSGKMSGLEAARKIWDFSDTPIIFVSGNRDRYMKAIPTLTQKHDFVTKPFTKNVLDKAIKSVLSSRSGRYPLRKIAN